MKLKRTGIVFQVTEAQIKDWVWNAKNYGKDASEETPVTPAELEAAKNLVRDHAMDYLQELVSSEVQS